MLFRSGADEPHRSVQHAPGLGQLVDAELADDLADAVDTGIILFRPDGDASHLRVLPHRSQLQYLEALTVEADPTLTNDGRPLALQLPSQGGQKNAWTGEQHDGGAYSDIGQALAQARKAADRKSGV